jgi:hypothetical protein
MRLTQALTDVGTVLPPDAAAFVWSPREGFYFLAPECCDYGSLAEEVRLMWAMATKLLTDTEFAEQVVRDWENSIRKRSQ